MRGTIQRGGLLCCVFSALCAPPGCLSTQKVWTSQLLVGETPHIGAWLVCGTGGDSRLSGGRFATFNAAWGWMLFVRGDTSPPVKRKLVDLCVPASPFAIQRYGVHQWCPGDEPCEKTRQQSPHNSLHASEPEERPKPQRIDPRERKDATSREFHDAAATIRSTNRSPTRAAEENRETRTRTRPPSARPSQHQP